MVMTTTSAPVDIIGATPVSFFTTNPRATHAPAAFVSGAHELLTDDDEGFWIELESTLEAREAAKALHPSSLHPRLRLAS